MKTCTKCKQVKTFDEFNKCSHKKDGLDPYCRSCRSEYYKSRNYDRSEYQAKYVRKVTDKRKDYLKKYQKVYKVSYRKRTLLEKKIYAIVKRVLSYKNEKKARQTNDYLGWSKQDFIEKVGECKPGYHLDHKVPITWFIDTAPVDIVNSLDNLHWIPEKENIAKRNRFCHVVSDDFLQKAKPYINPSFLTVL